MNQPKMKVPFNNFLIAIPSKFNETHKIGNTELIVPAIGENAEDQRTTKGKVVSCPSSWRKGSPTFVKTGKYSVPMYEGMFEEYLQEVKDGDTVHFSAMATKMGVFVGKDEDGMELYILPPHLLIAVERDEDVIPVGYRCLVSPKKSEGQRGVLFVPTEGKKIPGQGTIIYAQGNLKEYEGCECTYDEKYVEWIEINKVRYDAPYLSDISSIQLRIQ